MTESADIANGMLGRGLAVGDYDNDGRPDLYITGYGAGKLYRNSGKGTFTDVTGQAGVNNSLWGTSAAFFDYDAFASYNAGTTMVISIFLSATTSPMMKRIFPALFTETSRTVQSVNSKAQRVDSCTTIGMELLPM